MRKVITNGTILVVVFLLSACSASSSLIGKWGDSESLSPLLIYEFKADGVLIMSIKNVPVEGTYEIIDADTFRMTLPILGAERTTEMDFARSGDTLTFSSEGYSQTFYKTP